MTPSTKSPTKSAAVIVPEREHGNELKVVPIHDTEVSKSSGSDRKRRVATNGRSQSPSFSTASKRPKSNGSHPGSVVKEAAVDDILGKRYN